MENRVVAQRPEQTQCRPAGSASLALRLLVSLGVALALLPGMPWAAEPADTKVQALLTSWKQAERGPFVGVRWYCADGSVRMPRPYACEEVGGGRQHGLWSQPAQNLRENGYLIANILAAIPPRQLAAQTDAGLDVLTSVLIERYLMARDDGWIWRQARYFRGVLQDDDERQAARAALLQMLADDQPRKARLALIREAARQLPIEGASAPLQRIRTLSNQLAEQAPALAPLRNKIHTRLQPEDAQAVRRAQALTDQPEVQTELENLARSIDALFSSAELPQKLRRFARYNPPVTDALQTAADVLASSTPASVADLRRLAWAQTRLLHLIAGDGQPAGRLEAVQLSLALEERIFALGQRWLEAQSRPQRAELVDWLDYNLRALFGAAFITETEYDAAAKAIRQLKQSALTVEDYRQALSTLERVPQWARRRYVLFFGPMQNTLSAIEPMAADFVTDRLRASPVLVHSRMMDWLQRDLALELGLEHRILGEPLASGLQVLNPGVAQGMLRGTQELQLAQDRPQIALVEETVADLPSVAGIITADAGNALSHVQLLAQNLGIPNVVASGPALERLQKARQQELFMAASPGGVVHILGKTPELAVAEQAGAAGPSPLQPNLAKLELDLPAGGSGFIGLSDLTLADSGRRVGPKAAKLGELAQRFPGTVSPGLAIPFAWFARMLEQPRQGQAGPFRDWLAQRYAQWQAMPAGEARRALLQQTLQAAQKHVQTSPFPAGFQEGLRAAMVRQFGALGEFGVFVRSDTNIEDLPNFSGAGLNKTVPHVVGWEPTLAAIRSVWASVFSERSWGWRQAMIPDPMNVYAAVLLHQSVDVDASGVLITQGSPSRAPFPLKLTMNEGPGGGVSGQSAESWELQKGGQAQFLQSATEPYRYALKEQGGVRQQRVKNIGLLLNSARQQRLLELVEQIAQCCTDLLDDGAEVQPADVEFGFSGNNLVLFQIRPLVQNHDATSNAYLQALDQPMAEFARRRIAMQQPVSVEL